jgi:hypothetical protein
MYKRTMVVTEPFRQSLHDILEKRSTRILRILESMREQSLEVPPLPNDAINEPQSGSPAYAGRREFAN